MPPIELPPTRARRSRRIVAVAGVSDPGEPEIALLRVLSALRDRGWSVTLTTPSEGSLRDAALQERFRWVPLSLGGQAPGQGLRAVSSWPLIRWLARGGGVVYLNGALSARLLPALIVSRARRVLHVHDPPLRVPRFWRLAQVVLVPSQRVAQALEPLRAQVVRGPIDSHPRPAAAPWAADGRPVVAFVGRIEPRSGALDLVRAVPAIHAGAPDARVLIVGDDPLGIDPAYTISVTGAPHIEHHRWAAPTTGLLEHLDVLALPSHDGTGALVAAEAMAAGTPVVAACAGGLADVVQDGVSGRLVAPEDPAALAAAVLDVLRERERMSAAAREHARPFGLDHCIDQIERLITE